MNSFNNSTDSSVSHHNSSYGGVANEWGNELEDFLLQQFDHPGGEAPHEIPAHPLGLNVDLSSTTPHLSGLINGGEHQIMPTISSTRNIPHVSTATAPCVDTPPPPPPSMVKEEASASTKYCGENLHPMRPPASTSIKKRKRDDTPQTPSKKTKNHPFSILEHYSGEPKYCVITCPNSVVEFYCEIRKLSGKGGRPNTKTPVLALEYTTYEEVKAHLDKILKSSVEELECRNKSSTGNIKYPNLGDGIMLKYSITHSPTYEAGIESHMNFVCKRIVDTMFDNIKIINV